MNIFPVILGLGFLVAGRRVFWLFVGIVGFLAGMDFAGQIFPAETGITGLVIAAVVGIVGGILAMGFQWAAIVLVGFLGGGYFLMHIGILMWKTVESAWIFFLAGGIVGTVITILVFDWALVILTSLVGALLVVKNMVIMESLQGVVFVCCVLAGVIIQSFLTTRSS